MRGINSRIGIIGFICYELRGPDGRVKSRGIARNTVTNDGDEYYAERGAGETPTNDFGAATSQIVLLDNAGAAPAKTSNYSNIGGAVGSNNPDAFDSGYPKSNDDDTDNPSRTVDTVTYRISHASGDANGTIYRAAIHLSGATGTDPILMYGAFGASFTKASGDTLKVWINHLMNGS